MYYDGMRQRVVGTVLAVLMITCMVSVQSVAAVSPDVVISSIQTGTSTSLSHEFIELYNNADADRDITNWCVYYASATSTTNGGKMACFVVDSSALHLYLPAKSQAFLISTVLRTANPLLGSDLLFSATLSGPAGHVRLVDSNSEVVDKVGWGLTALAAESSPAPVAPIGQVIKRITVSEGPGILQDTDNNAADFELGAPTPTHAYGSIYEVQDLCVNIDGIQTSIPDLFTSDDLGTCSPPPIDQCINLEGMQATLPDGFELDSSGGCVDTDACHNLTGIQELVPVYYQADAARYCSAALPLVIVNEVLPNPDGDDEGNEFIELYNPNNTDIDLGFYVLVVGASAPKAYHFPAGTSIPAYSYMSFSDDDINFTLINSTGRVSLVDPDGQIISSGEYIDPPAGFSWALFDTTWDYTNVPTRTAVNQPSSVDGVVEEEVVGAKPCGVNQYRHPETNRCRLLITAGSTLTPCRDDQYRSEETNRCRTISSTTATLAACGENQERNTDTNRCRNVVTSVPSVPFAVEPIPEAGQAVIGWWALGGIGILALAYGTWEWRAEIAKASRRIAGFFVRGK